MRSRYWLRILVLAFLAGCESAVVGWNDAALSLQIRVAGDAALASVEEGRVHIEGPTSKVVSVTPGTTQTIEGLLPGTYTVALEGLTGGEVETFGETTGVSVAAGQNTSVTVTMDSFVPGFLTLPPDAIKNKPLDIEFGAVAGAVGYRVEWALNPAFTGLHSVETSTTNVTITIDTDGTNFVRVRALDRFGGSGRPGQSASIDVVDAPPLLLVTPPELDFTAEAGGSPPAAQTISISNAGGGTLDWSVATSTPWLIVDPIAGTDDGNVTATVDVSGLPEGTYSGSITVAANTANSPLTVPVSLTVAPGPAIAVTPASLTFTADAGGPDPGGRKLLVTNAGAGTLDWTIAFAAPWLTVSPTSGADSTTVDVAVSTTGLAAGTYVDTIRVSGNAVNSPVAVPVIVSVLPPPAINVSQSSLGFSGYEGGPDPAPQPFTISNAGGGALTWNISTNASWLTVMPSSGIQTATVAASVSTAGLSAGTYNATITISGNATNSPVEIPVVLQVTPPPGPTISNYNVVLLVLNDTIGCSNNGSLFEHSFTYSDPGGTVSVTSSIVNGSYLFSSGTSGTFTTAPRSVTGTTSGVVTYRRCTTFGSSTGVTYSATLTDDQGRTSNQVSFLIPKPMGANDAGSQATGAAEAASRPGPVDGILKKEKSRDPDP